MMDMIKKYIAFLLCAVMAVPMCTVFADDDELDLPANKPYTKQCTNGSIYYEPHLIINNWYALFHVNPDKGYELGMLNLGGETYAGSGLKDTKVKYFFDKVKGYEGELIMAYFDKIDGKLSADEINSYITDGERLSEDAKLLFDGIVNSYNVENYASLTDSDDVILYAGDGKQFEVTDIIAYSKYKENDKASFKIHLADTPDEVKSDKSVEFTSKAGEKDVVAVIRPELLPKRTIDAKYMYIDYTDDTKLSELKIYADVVDAPEETPAPAATPEPAKKSEKKPIKVKGGSEMTVSVGEDIVEFPDAKPFVDENGRTQIPIRAVAELIGGDVKWDGDTRTVTVTDADGSVVTLVIGSDIMTVDGSEVKMDTAALIKDDRTFIPVRFVAEAMGLEVQWSE